MGTKKNPGTYDCYAKALANEPMFILLGRDPIAAALVEIWAEIKDALTLGQEPEVVADAKKCAAELDAWAARLGKPKIEISVLSIDRVARQNAQNHAGGVDDKEEMSDPEV